MSSPILLSLAALLLLGCSAEVSVGRPVPTGSAVPTEMDTEPPPTVVVHPGPGMPAVGAELAVDIPVNGPDLVREPSLACALSTCLVTWRSGRGIVAARVSADGELLDELGIPLAPEHLAPQDAGQGPFVVGHGEDEFFVLWAGPAETESGTLDAHRSLYVVHVDGSGMALPPRPILLLLQHWHPDRPLDLSDLGADPAEPSRHRLYVVGERGTEEAPSLRVVEIHMTRTAGWIFRVHDADAPGLVSGTAVVTRGTERPAMEHPGMERPVVAWAARSETGARIEVTEPHRTGSPSATFIDPGARGVATVDVPAFAEARLLPRPIVLATSQGTLTVGWAQGGAEPEDVTMLAQRIEGESFRFLDAAPIEIASGMIRESEPTLPHTAHPDGVLFSVGDWIVEDDRDALEWTAPAARFLPAHGPPRLRSIRFDPGVYPRERGRLSAMAPIADTFVAVRIEGWRDLGSAIVTARLGESLPPEGPFLGGSSNRQNQPRAMCGAEQCVVAWLDSRAHNQWRAIRVDRVSGMGLDDDSFALFEGRDDLIVSTQDLVIDSDGTDLLLVTTANSRGREDAQASVLAQRLGADGTLSEVRETVLPGSPLRPGDRLAIGWNGTQYVVGVELLYAEGLYVLRLASDGTVRGAPVSLGRGGAMAMAPVGRGALVVHVPSGGNELSAVHILDDVVSEPTVLDFVGRDEHEGWRAPALVSRGDEAFLAWVVGDHYTRKQQIRGVTLDGNAQRLEPVRELATEYGFVNDVSVLFDEQGMVLAYGWRELRSDRRRLSVMRSGVDAPERLVVAEGITTLGFAVAKAGDGSLLTAYPRFGRRFGIVRDITRPAARVMRRFAYLPGQVR